MGKCCTNGIICLFLSLKANNKYYLYLRNLFVAPKESETINRIAMNKVSHVFRRVRSFILYPGIRLRGQVRWITRFFVYPDRAVGCFIYSFIKPTGFSDSLFLSISFLYICAVLLNNPHETLRTDLLYDRPPNVLQFLWNVERIGKGGEPFANRSGQ